jgi:hypothetical protein
VGRVGPILPLACPLLRLARPSWSEPIATSAPIQDEVIQAVLGMNQKHILPRPRFLVFSISSLPQSFSSYLLPPSYVLHLILVSMRTLTSSFSGGKCRNLNLGLTTKAKACKVAGQEGSLGVTSRAPMSAKECEGMNLHTPK